MSELVVIREMQEKDILALDTQFVQQGWPSRQEILMNYLEEQLVKQRTVFVAEKKATLLGYLTLLPLAKEGPFKNLYPEIADFNVFLPFQKQGVGRLLLNRAENVAKSYADTVSLGVGLHPGYGAAQRLYIKQGYVPDGSGVWFQNKQLKPNDRCVNDDELVLYLSKKQ